MTLTIPAEGEPMAKQGEDWADRGLSLFLGALRKLAPAYIVIAILGLIPLIVVGSSAPSGLARVVGGGAMAGVAAFAAGGLLGFLFGIPRVLQTGTEPSDDANSAPRLGYRVNTNLEQISDWLTKILVGVGLTQLPKIAEACGRLIAAVADGMGAGPGMTSLAGAILIYCISTGFLASYYVTRTTLTASFFLSDAELSDFREQMRSTEKATEDVRNRTEKLAHQVQALQQGTDGTTEDLKRPPEIHSHHS
jgi:hypothetical protein